MPHGEDGISLLRRGWGVGRRGAVSACACSAGAAPGGRRPRSSRLPPRVPIRVVSCLLGRCRVLVSWRSLASTVTWTGLEYVGVPMQLQTSIGKCEPG